MDKKKWLSAGAGAGLGLTASRIMDLSLIGACVATATGTVAFAGYMMMRGDHTPLINGMQYLAIYAQPSHPRHVADAQRPEAVDMAPVGALSRDGQDRTSGYQLVGAEPRFAWLRQGDHIFAVHPGDEVARLGKIASIEQRDGRWTLVDEKGATLIASALVDPTGSAGGRFGKPMIFGAER
jgi:hypothetical protein